MANKNEFLPFANNSTSNVIEQSSYDSLDARKTGFSSGVAKSAQLNKVWRQSSIVASAIGQFIADTNKVDVLDDGDVPKLAIELGKAISAGASGVKSFNGVVGAVTISEGSNITIQKNGNDFKISSAGGTGGVTSVNGKTGVVTLTYSDVNAAPIASPAFTGTPTAPTATKGDATTKLATTAFVENAISGISAGVVSLNNISGAVNLVAGSNVTITPSGKNITISASGGGGGAVTSVNGKTGAVTLTATDVGATTTAWVQQQGYAKLNGGNTFSGVQTSQAWNMTGNDSIYHNSGITGVWISAAGVNNFIHGQDGQAYKKGGGAWSDYSDRALKTNIAPFEACLEVIKSLNPVEFTWKGQFRGGERTVGFIADEVEKVLPDAVTEFIPSEAEKPWPPEFAAMVDIVGEGGKVKAVGFKNEIFAYLVGGIKELGTLLAKQQIEIEELRAKIK